MRRTLTIVAIVIVLAGILAIAYFFFFANSGPTLTTDTENPFGAPGGDLGQGGGQGTDTPDTSAGDNTPVQVTPKLVEITPGPVAKGFLVIDTVGVVNAAATDTPVTADRQVLYIKRASGNIFSYLASTRTIARLSNRTIPGIQEVSWLPDGSLAFVRYLAIDEDKSQHIETYALPVNGDSGYFLPRDLSAATAAGSSTVFTLLSSTDGSVGAFTAPDGTNVRTLFTSALSQLSVRLSNPTTIIATTKPSASLSGYAFSVVPGTGALTQIMGPTTGLEAIPSPSGKYALLSSVDAGGLHLAVLDIAAHTWTNLPVATLAEKCVWTSDSAAVYCAVPVAIPQSTLPDDWFQGTVSFADKLWRIDLTARVATLAADLPALTDTAIDAIQLTLDPQAGLLVFSNKRDGSLWAYSL